MPSEYQKKKMAKKKELAKQKGGKKVKEDTPDSDVSGTATPSLNGTGTATPLENGGTATPSSSNGATSKNKEMSPTKTYEEELCEMLEKQADLAAEARACTGSLAIHPMARDIKIANFSVTFHGAELLVDTKLELSVGQR